MIADRHPVDGNKGVTGLDWRQALTVWLPICAWSAASPNCAASRSPLAS